MNKDRGNSLLTANEVAELLHVSRSYAYKLMVKGKLPFIQIGKSRRVHPDDLQKFIQENKEMAKRRGNNEGSIYKRSNGTWRAQVKIRGAG